jgi:hypothetical protein
LKVLGHDDVACDYETIALASLFENVEEEISSLRSAKQRQAAVATARDEVEVIGTVVAG